jgi:hypothetical protein
MRFVAAVAKRLDGVAIEQYLAVFGRYLAQPKTHGHRVIAGVDSQQVQVWRIRAPQS